jgi:NhaA family Na+:H+ antiporter
MSLFIGGLAFEGLGPAYEVQVKLGVLCGSLLAGSLGALVLWFSSAQASRSRH